MSNELIEKSSFGVDFQPAKIEMKNYEVMKNMVEQYAEKYQGLVFTRDEKAGALEARSELIAAKDTVESERKRIKQEAEKPIDKFDKSMRAIEALIEEPLNDVRDGIKQIEEEEKEERKEALNELLIEKTEGTGVSIDDIEKDDRWLNKGNWTSKLNPTGKFEAEVENAVEAAVKEKERKENEIRILEEFCKAQDIDPAGWISQLDYKDAMEVINLINLEKERKERLAKEQEEKKKEHDEFIAKQQETLNEIDEIEEVEEETITNVISVTGTVSQLKALNEYLVTSGIEVEQVDIDLSIDDLPF